MKYYDLHTHSRHSDGQAAIAELVEAAAKKGYGLGVSDHLYCGGMDSREAVCSYLDELESYPVLKGCEANIGEDYSCYDKIISRFDYVIASLHHIPDFQGNRLHIGRYFGERAGDAGCVFENPFLMEESERYLTNVIPVIERTMQTQRMEIYGHCTVLPFCEYLAGTAFIADWENTLISLCLKYDVAMEISGLWKEPGLDMVRRAKAAGIKFTLGSDCHLKKDICNIEYAIAVTKNAGLCEEDFLFMK